MVRKVVDEGSGRGGIIVHEMPRHTVGNIFISQSFWCEDCVLDCVCVCVYECQECFFVKSWSIQVERCLIDYDTLYEIEIVCN